MHEGEDEFEELEALREDLEECDAYLDAWEIYEAEDDLDEELEEELAGEWDQVYEYEEEDVAEIEYEPIEDQGVGATQTKSDLGTARAELAHLRASEKNKVHVSTTNLRQMRSQAN